MEALLNCKPEDLEDYYGLLGCNELSSTGQILNEYKIRALACHPDKHLDNPKAVNALGCEKKRRTNVGGCQADYCHRRFRWAADSPSSLLQKFRNYEI
ncbi:dnaJ homolog subfamily C member 12 isoform X3 [Entelurus aequoreus]|uniref:dnaJ homolog subfamily C member 12 isoform X3 n=1 Tax=Entelurus aequoreus TaxID=161455 RepID=UPI002B1D275A|nr:dnaJ homolog subfamily C member 12 isoform X3 [Entelurus aequoreus]